MAAADENIENQIYGLRPNNEELLDTLIPLQLIVSLYPELKSGSTDDIVEPGIYQPRRVIYNGKSISVCQVPDDGESLCYSCAHHLFGPFRSVGELRSVANKLHRRAVDYIRKNKEDFFMDLINLYEKLFPNNGLKPELAFESCCFYLSKPGHSAVKLIMNAISSLFSKPIVVLYESCKEPTKITPFRGKSSFPVNAHNVPIALFCCDTPNYLFFPIDEITPEILAMQDIPRRLPEDNINKPSDIIAATWFCRGFYMLPVAEAVDKALAENHVMLACVQGAPGKQSMKFNCTNNYNWFHSENTCVVFLIHKKCPGKVTNLCSLSSNLVSALFSYNNTDFLMIGCCLPKASKDFTDIDNGMFSKTEFERISHELTLAINKTEKLPNVFLFGQFNAQIGSKDLKPSDKRYIGAHLLHEQSNENGKFIKDLAISNRFRIISTIPCSHSYTPATYKAISPDPGRKKNKPVKFQISHLLVRSDGAEFIRNYRWWHPISDHAIVASKFIIN